MRLINRIMLIWQSIESFLLGGRRWCNLSLGRRGRWGLGGSGLGGRRRGSLGGSGFCWWGLRGGGWFCCWGLALGLRGALGVRLLCWACGWLGLGLGGFGSRLSGHLWLLLLMLWWVDDSVVGEGLSDHTCGDCLSTFSQGKSRTLRDGQWEMQFNSDSQIVSRFGNFCVFGQFNFCGSIGGFEEKLGYWICTWGLYPLVNEFFLPPSYSVKQ